MFGIPALRLSAAKILTLNPEKQSLFCLEEIDLIQEINTKIYNNNL